MPGSSADGRRTIVVAAVVLVVDQITKWICVQTLLLNTPYPVVDGFVSLTYVRNRGMAFGLLRDVPGPGLRWGLVGVSLLAILLIWMYARQGADTPAVNLSFGAILGGALGNLLDRLRLGYVVDFIDVHWNELHWPAFNIADSAITIGGVVLFLALAREGPERDAADDGVENSTTSSMVPSAERGSEASPTEGA